MADDLPSPKILLVDDEHDIVHVMKTGLEAKGILFMIEDVKLMADQNPELANLKIRWLTKKGQIRAEARPIEIQSNIYTNCRSKVIGYE